MRRIRWMMGQNPEGRAVTVLVLNIVIKLNELDACKCIVIPSASATKSNCLHCLSPLRVFPSRREKEACPYCRFLQMFPCGQKDHMQLQRPDEGDWKWAYARTWFWKENENENEILSSSERNQNTSYNWNIFILIHTSSTRQQDFARINRGICSFSFTTSTFFTINAIHLDSAHINGRIYSFSVKPSPTSFTTHGIHHAFLHINRSGYEVL